MAEQSPTPIELQLQQTMEQVFGNYLLREKILEDIIYPSDNNVNYADVRNVRLVQKSWTISTSKLLRRKGDPLYNVSTSAINSRGQPLNIEEHEILNSFVSTITQPKRIESFIPPLNLRLVCAFFVTESHEALSKFLVSCGPGLMSLDMTIPKNCTMPYVFPQFCVPNLQQLSIKFVVHSHSDDENFHNPTEDRQNAGVTCVIQQILNSTCKLEKLEFTAGFLAESDLVPSGLDLLCLPKSVKTLLIKCPVLEKHLDMVVPSNIPSRYAHLSKVEIMASEIPFPQDTINRILGMHRDTLKEIKLSGKEYQSVDRNLPSLFKMPPIKNLEKFTLASPSWLCLYNFFMKSTINYPNLTTFKMERVTVALFNQITDRYRVNLKTVKNLKVWLVSEQDVVNHFETTITLNLEIMQSADLTFNCVTNLDITVCGIFREMGQLISLAITVENVRGNNMICSAWDDGLFIGAPPGIAKCLRKHTNFWDYFKLKADTNYPSIQKLTALSKLTLASSNMPIHYGSLTGMSGRLVSEVSLHYALLKMPGLKNLHLFGRFQLNEVMINLWGKGKELVGSLVYGETKEKLRMEAD